MRVAYHIPNDDLRAAQEAAIAAEAAGFDGVVALENAHGPIPPLAVSALATEKVQLGTAVAIAFPRSPTIAAHFAWDLNKASNGRFYLGLGSQVKGHNERRYGLTWTPPAPRMRDYVGAVRAVWRAWETGEALDYQSDAYTLTLTTPNFSPKPLGLPRIPIAMSAVGPAMLRTAGEVADGVRLHPFSTRRYLEEVSLARINKGLGKVGRPRSEIEVVSGAFIATGVDDEAVAKMREYVRFRIAFYCSTRAYWDVLRLHGLEELGEKLRPYPAQNRWDEMAALIPDDVLELFAIVGRHDELASKVAAKYEGLADTLSLFIPTDTAPGPLGDVIRDIQRIPMRFEGYAPGW
ncbi:MAG: TIGR03617 family F420-dependent LLM class oxidoreductase [Alphaproteobacteria bacterium]